MVTSPQRLPSSVVMAAGVVAALHVSKLSPAIPMLRDQLGISMVAAGFLLSMVQLAGMTSGVVIGMLADQMGRRRSVIAGLGMLTLASALGGGSQSALDLLAARALEGLGFLMVVTPAPALLRNLVDERSLPLALGAWGCYMPLATSLALFLGALVVPVWGWRIWWWVLGLVTLGTAVAVSRYVPGDMPVSVRSGRHDFLKKMMLTLGSPGPWLVAVAFGLYSGQWLAVVGFLPSLYQSAGWPTASVAFLGATVAAVNILGNLASGWALRKWQMPVRQLYFGYVLMAMGSWMTFQSGVDLPLWARLAGVGLFSACGGLVPGTLFSLAVRLAPAEHLLSSTLGWMQQCSSLGQFVGPPVVAWVATGAGGDWSRTWLVTGAAASLGMLVATLIGKRLRRGPTIKSKA